MQGLPLVELGVNPATELFAFQIAEDEDRLDQAAIFLQGPGHSVLAGVGLELANQQRRGDPAALQRPGDPQQLIPVPQNPVAVDPPFEQSTQAGMSLLAVEAEQPLVPRSRMRGENCNPSRSNRAKTISV